MRKHLFLTTCLLLLSGSLFAQSLETDKGNVASEATDQNVALDESMANEELVAQAMAATAPEDLISPEVANPTMGREVNSTVDYYTGAGNVGVMLYNISSYGVNIPVSVNYSASGVKVDDDNSTPVGNNWRLTGGGRISRMILGGPDEEPDGYLYPDYSYTVSSKLWNEAATRTRIEKKIDTEPDLYRFELPTGVSGAFVINQDFSITTLLPHQDIKIEWIYKRAPGYSANYYVDPDDPDGKVWEGLGSLEYGAMYFIITDAQGIKYHFGTNEDYKEFSYNKDYRVRSKYISGWLLRRITYGDKEIARYTYGSFNKTTKYFFNDMQRYKYKAQDNSSEWLNRIELDKSIEVYPKQMTEIKWSLGKIEFIYDDPIYPTCPGPKLNHINVYGYDNDLLKSIHTAVSYFGYSGFHARLDRIYEKSGDLVRNICAFQYYDNGANFPGGTTAYDVDYWGYWTGDSSPYEQHSIAGKSFSSRFKKPNLITTRCGTLQKILYPTGGWTEFEYELNKGRLYTDTPLQQQTVGGLRVKSITNYESANTVASTTRYEYENPNEREKGGLIMSGYKPGPRIRKDTGSGSGRVIIYSLNRKPDFPMTDFTGASVVYNYVKEILPNGAYTTYEFTDFSSMPDSKGLSALTTSSGVGSSSPDWQYKVPYSTRFYGRGLLKKVAKYDSSDQMVHQEEYSYNYGNVKSSINVYTAFVTDEESGSPKFYRGNYQWSSQPVVLASKTVRGKYTPESTTEYSYTSDYKDLLPRNIESKSTVTGSDNFRTTITYPQDYTYSGTPTQGTEVDGIVQLQKMGIKSVPIETIKYRKNYGEANWNVLGASINIYKWNQTAALPVLEQTKALIVNSLSSAITKSSISGDVLLKDSRYDTNNSQSIKFNAQGNPEFITLSGSTGRGTRIIYGYNGHIPVATVTNSTSNVILAYSNFEKGSSSSTSMDKAVFLGNRAKSGDYVLQKNTQYILALTATPYIISYWRWDGNDNTDWQEVRVASKGALYVIKEPNHYVDEIRAIPVDASMTTQVVKPGVGVISKVDQKGQAVRYEYNSLGMLESAAIDGQTVEKYTYREGSEFYNLSASVASGSSGRGTASVNPARVSTGGSATFTATPNSGYQFSQWQFSDGTTSANAVTVRSNIRFNLTGTASFVEYRQRYNMSAVVAGASSGRGTASVNPAQVNEGESATWSATAYNGYIFDHWEFSDGTTATTSSVTKTNISRNITGTAFFKDKPKQPVNFYGTIMPRNGYWAINISCTPDIISDGSVKVYATGYFFINPDTPERIDAQFDGQVGEDGYVLSNARFDENSSVGELNGTIFFSDPNYTVGTVGWH